MSIRPRLSVKLNIPLLYAIAFFGGLIFWMGIERLFLLSIGGDGFAVSLNAVVFVAIALTLDIPTGALADKWGRKTMLMAGLASLFCSSLAYGLSHSPNTYIIGTVLFALALATINGAIQALTYDTLKELDDHKSYSKIYGKLQAALAVGAGLALLSSGFLAHHFGFRFNFRLALISSAIALIISLLLTEPTQHKFGKNKASLKTAVKLSFATIRASSLLIATAVLLLTVRTFQWMSDSYSQLVFSKFGIALSWIGVLSFLAVGGGAIGRLVAHRYHGHIRRVVFIMITLFACAGFAPKPIALVGLIGFYGFNQLMENICETNIQHHLPSHIRATATSVFSFVSTLLLVPFGLITGVIIKRYDVLMAFKVATVLGALALAWWALRSHTRLDLPITDKSEPEGSLPV
jgi:MFS family permease